MCGFGSFVGVLRFVPSLFDSDRDVCMREL